MPEETRARDGIQALRALAFLCVLVQHSVHFGAEIKGLNPASYLPINFGMIGVFLFFTISGFVMGECLGQGSRFIANRLVRIYPPFWLAIGLSFIFLHGAEQWKIDVWSVLLLPSSDLNNTYAIPYWSLCYEMAFYVAVYAMILARFTRHQVALLCIGWIVLVVVYEMYFGLASASAPGWSVWLAPSSIFFAVGLFLSTARPGFLDDLNGAQLLFAAAIIWAFSHSYASRITSSHYAVLAVSAGLLLLASRKLSFPHLLIKIGDMSYGAYLVHFMVMVSIMLNFRTEIEPLHLSLATAVMFFSAGLVGIAFGWVEHQLHTRVFKRLFSSKPALTSAASTA